MSEAPEPICNLPGVLRALRNASGALSSQGDQIDQMKGMFGDEDGTIAAAVEAGEDSHAELQTAIAFVSALIEAEAYDATVAQGIEAEAAAHDLEIAAELAEALDGARAAGLAKPTAVQLHDLARDIRDELVGDLGKVEQPEDAEVVLSYSTAEHAIDMLIGAAVAADDAADPIVPDVLIKVHAGMVQDVVVVEGQPRVRIFVENDDIEGRDPYKDNDLVLLADEDPKVPDLHADLYTTHGDALPADGRRWSTLRAEAARLHAGGVRSDLVEDDGTDRDADATGAG